MGKMQISIRNIRREANDELKKLLKDRKFQKELLRKDYSRLFDSQISTIDDRVSTKEKEIMTI